MEFAKVVLKAVTLVFQVYQVVLVAVVVIQVNLVAQMVTVLIVQQVPTKMVKVRYHANIAIQIPT